jgi:hypothetical protein
MLACPFLSVLVDVRGIMKTFVGQTEQNAFARAMPIVRGMQNRFSSQQQLVQQRELGVECHPIAVADHWHRAPAAPPLTLPVPLRKLGTDFNGFEHQINPMFSAHIV